MKIKKHKYVIKYWLIIVFLFSGLSLTYGVEGTLWSPYLEWSLENPSYSGNPYDLVATVTFTHTLSGERHRTEMFYNGSDVWKFRFTGTRTGDWTFETASSDPELDGHSGNITIKKNADPKMRGFLCNIGNKFAIQTSSSADLKGYIFTVYMNGVEFGSFVGTFGPDMGQVQSKTEDYLNDALENGFEIIFVYVTNSWFQFGAKKHNEHSSENPDPLTFRVLEKIITTAHKAGGRVHIWAWGDESRKWTPIGVGGINGGPDRRLQRYIAARLGPLPGWTMGYGFDLDEWTNPSQLNSWANYMHQHFGWQHFLCARGYMLTGTGNNINAYGGFGREPLTTTRYGPADYQEIVEDLDGELTRPHLYEERHSYLRSGFNLSMDGTRQLLWWESMAGGMGGFFGFYSSSPYPYPNPEQLRTHYSFWHKKNRFVLDMERANELSNDSNTRVLKSGNTKYVFYREDAGSINMNLSGMTKSQSAVAVDTKKQYDEIDIGLLSPQEHTWDAPYVSDWAIAVGNWLIKQSYNWDDIAAFAGQWLAGQCLPDDWCGGFDLNFSTNVDFADFAELAVNWLRPLPNQLPWVYITDPQEGASFHLPYEIGADAWDNGGSVVGVEFFADESKVGEDNNGTDGWTTNWQSYPAGGYSLTAKAIDDDGATGISPAVTVTVYPPR